MADPAEKVVLRWFGHVEKMKDWRCSLKKIIRSDASGTRVAAGDRNKWRAV